MLTNTRIKKAILAGMSAFAVLGVIVACQDDALQQGTEFSGNGLLAMDAATDREDTGLCDGDVCISESGTYDADAGMLPTGDADIDPTNTCETAVPIGSVDADQNAGTLMTAGTCSEWVSFRATEGDSSAFGAPMKMKITLTPTAANFDLYVFFDPNKDDLSCTTAYASSVTASTTQEGVELTWGETGEFSNGSDDSRTISVAVVKADGPCGSGSWTLLAEGNK